MNTADPHKAICELMPDAYHLHMMHSVRACSGRAMPEHNWRLCAMHLGLPDIDLEADTPEALLELATAEARKIYGPKPVDIGGCV